MNMAKSSGIVFMLMVLCFAAVLQAADKGQPIPQRNDFIENGRFLQIPGPNPILRPGPDDQWDGRIIEACDAFKDFGTYYLYYHGAGNVKGFSYQIGVATATNPLGPFKKYEKNPIVKIGKKGDWDGMYVACAMVVKEGIDKYYMFYTGRNDHGPTGKGWDVGLATAPGPLGPWTPYEGNPLMKDFGYVGGVVKVKGKYFLYGEHPHTAAEDYGPLILATADAPQGPWIVETEPVLKQGEWGEWDSGGISEAEVLYHSGVFHLFYSGTKAYNPRKLSRESLGYAFSYDGYNWSKYGLNPVATREANPNAAAFSEAHSIIEPPFVYIYHTLRYKAPWRPGDEKKFPWVEDMGVQVLVTNEDFSLEMPLIDLETLEAGKKLLLYETPTINLSGVKRVALTAQCTYTKTAKKPLRLEVVSSPDGLKFDTKPLYVFEHDLEKGQTVRQTFELNTKVKYLKVLVDNPDKQVVSDVEIIATLGS